GDVAPMAEEHVEIDEIREDQSALGFTPKPIENGHALRIRGCWRRVDDAAAGENIADFAHTMYGQGGVGDRIEHGVRRRQRKIVPATRALPGAGFADERTRDHPTNAKRVCMTACDAADFVEAFERDDILMRGNLHGD